MFSFLRSGGNGQCTEEIELCFFVLAMTVYRKATVASTRLFIYNQENSCSTLDPDENWERGSYRGGRSSRPTPHDAVVDTVCVSFRRFIYRWKGDL